MQVQIHTDHHIEGHEALAAWATSEVTRALAHHSAQIMRLEVHLADENGHKLGPDDKRCVLEARLVGRPALAVTQHATTLYLAVSGAADKLNRLIESSLGRAARTDTSPQ
jgi:ribosome-associated translation inhibitor RaiA